MPAADRDIVITSPLGEEVLLFKEMHAREELGRLFEYELVVLSTNGAIVFKDIVGQSVTVEMKRTTGVSRFYNGIVNRFSQSSADDQVTADGDILYGYRMTLVPRLWLLTRRADCRMFQEQTAVDIIKKILGDAGITIGENLSRSYRTWEYCVQYRETDFNFISRLMEQEGIYYYFTHEQNKHTMMLVDAIAGHGPAPGVETLVFRPDGAPENVEHVSHWARRQALQPGAYAQLDFDFVDPKKDMLSRAVITRDHAEASAEIFDYPGEYVTLAEGDDYSRIRIEEYHASFDTIVGQTNTPDVRPGYTFKLDEHHRTDQNAEYLVIATSFSCETSPMASLGVASAEYGGVSMYRCEFTCIPSSQQFRPRRITPKPVVQGPQTAIVAGKSDEEI